MGAPTVRHLQYLLSIDYFNADPSGARVDKSDWVASMTCISPAFNGTTKVYSSGMNAKYQLESNVEDPRTYWASAMRHGYKVFAFAQQMTEPSGT